MPQNLTNFDAALKNLYSPGMRNALNNSNPVLTEVVHDTENVSGRKCIWSVHSARSNSTGARAESGTLPSADRQRYIAPEDDLCYLYHTIKVTGQAVALTQNTNGSFGKALDQETQGAESDVKVDLARQMFNQAITINSLLTNGALALINGTPSVNVITIGAPELKTTTFSNITRKFFIGEKLDSVTPGSGAVSQAGMTITAITPATPSVTVDSSGSAADGDALFRAGSFGSAGDGHKGSEINGLQYILGTQTYATVSAASNTVWNGNTVGSSSEGISENLLESAIEKVQTDGDGSTPSLAIVEQTQLRKLASVVQQQKRYAPPSVTLEAGWKGVDVAGLNVVADRFCPSYRGFVLSPDQLAWFVGLDWQWDDIDGRVLFKALDGSDGVEARYKAYVNLQAYKRNSHTVVTWADPTF